MPKYRSDFELDTDMRVTYQTGKGLVRDATGNFRHLNDDWLFLAKSKRTKPILRCLILKIEEV